MVEFRRLRIDRLGRRGEGVADFEGRAIYVPYALPGEVIQAEIDGDRGHIVDSLEPRPDRIQPICPYYERCGGCAVQTLPAGPYAAWKRDLVATALRQAGMEAPVRDLVDAHGEGRRRATFHARAGSAGQASEVGFMEARTHRIVPIEFCPILAPSMASAVGVAKRLPHSLADTGKPLDILITSSDDGLDVDLRGLGPADPERSRALVTLAGDLDLARLSNHGDILVERRAPTLRFGRARVVLPPGAFLQPTRRGEEALAEAVLAGVGPARKVLDLFCGAGTFALRLADRAAVQAYDNDAPAVAALGRAARAEPAFKPVSAAVRDLWHRPLRVEELSGFDALVFDPPRAGAAAQVAEIARSVVPTVVAVSCDAGTFARDAAALVRGGYVMNEVTPIDQFRYSAHVEIVAVFRRAATKRKRRLLS